jgi:hypothetical protein
MTFKFTRTRILIAGAVTLVLGMVIWYINDPNGGGTAELHWKESVQLASGETVQIKRHVKFTQHWMMGVQMMSAQEYSAASIELYPPQKDFPRWEAPLQPIYLDRDPESREWIVVAGEGGRGLWPWNGRPCPPHWAFRLRNGVWYLQPVLTGFIGRKTNLLQDIRLSDDHRLFSPRFQSAVIDRKKRQFELPSRISGAVEKVGVVHSLDGYCSRYSVPQFTSEFLFEQSPILNLSRFPRIP